MSDSTTERWLPVVGYEGSYEVSDHGRVRGVDRMVYAGAGRQRLSRGRVLKAQFNRQTARYTVDLRVEAARRVRPVSSLVLEAFIGPRPTGLQTCHNDGDSSNDRLSNLRWDTPSENMWDKTRHGTHHNLRKVRCPEGHPYADDNLVVVDGRRYCRECKRKSARDRQRRLRQRAVPAN